MTRLRAEGGFTLIELLVATSIMTFVVMATITAFVSANRNERVNRLQNESQDQARMTMDTLAVQLRNLASPNDFQPKAVEVAEPDDLVFQTVDPVKPVGSTNARNIKRVRYCLGPSSSGKETLWRQQQKWTAPNPPSTIPSHVNCPDGAWGNQLPVATDVVSREQSPPLETFTYSPGPSPRDAIRGIHVALAVDVNPGQSPKAALLATGVFLRNQNRAPVAACTATYSGNGRQIVLNGSASEDPEGHNLESYEWYRTGNSNQIANGIVALWTAPAAGSYSFNLLVRDHAGLQGQATCGPVTVP